jgi:hypothetical protein
MLGLGTSIIKANLYQSLTDAALFDGTNDFVTVSDHDDLSFTSSTGFGISMWINLNSKGSSISTSLVNGLLMKSEEYSIVVRYITSNITQFEFRVKDDSSNKIKAGVTGLPSFPLNQWVHIIAEYNTSKNVNVYVNNDTSLATYEINQEGFVDLENTSADLLIGKSSVSGTSNLIHTNGLIKNLCIYSGTLSSTERTNVYNATQTGIFTNFVNNTIVAYYPLISNINDVSGNNHNGSSADGQLPTFI